MYSKHLSTKRKTRAKLCVSLFKSDLNMAFSNFVDKAIYIKITYIYCHFKLISHNLKSECMVTANRKRILSSSESDIY